LTPLLVALQRGSLTRVFILGLITGSIYFTGTIYWVTGVMAEYGHMQFPVAVLVNALLIAYLSLYPAIFAMVVRRLVARLGPSALLVSPLVWVTTELGRTYIITGFPWVLLGYSQVTVLPVAQLASVFGVYGLSALVVSVSAGAAVVAIGSEPKRFVPLAVAVAAVVLAAGWGSVRLNASSLTTSGETLRVGMLQGNVDQAEKWDPRRANGIFSDYLRKTETAIAGGAQLVVWPEASTPFTFEDDVQATQVLRDIVRRSKVPLLLGSNQIEHGATTTYYNSAFLTREDGSTAGVYRKMHLVPFGEYVPLKKILFFAAPLTEDVGEFSAGQSGVLLPLDGHPVSTAICYEIVYPALVRAFAASGSELLITITNDAWFGRTSAPFQHFEQASMRAIENGRYLVRAANTGISGVVDPYGRVVAQTGIFEPAVLVEQVRLIRASTIYTRIGDAFAYASVLITLALLVLARTPRTRMNAGSA
jgi:apolipoprotein N-acyltransferase